ncbi:MAG: caspase family protein, partial [Flammeovirgaceae bacterium]|nr:caspase family protein [Flammeovirgaceae bacterium]
MKKFICFLVSSFWIAIAFTTDAIQLQGTTMTTLRAVLIMCDTYESPENNVIAQSVRIDLNTITQFLNLLEKRNIVSVERVLLQGKNATLQNIQNTLSQLKTESNDVLWVFFSGHGGMEKGKSFLLTSDEKMLWRSDLENALKVKNARLKIFFTDACSNEVGELQVSRSLSRGVGAAQEGEYDHIYKALLFNYEGFMHVSSSSEGEYAWSDSNLGGFFTHYFIREGLIKKPSESWEEIFKMAKEKTAQMYERIPATQRSELASQGVKSQTPKAFSLPTLKKDLPQVIVSNSSSQPVTETKKTPKAVIENKTNRKIECWIADGVLQNWRILRINPLATIEIPIKKDYITLGFDSEGENIYYDLEDGKFIFQEDYDG